MCKARTNSSDGSGQIGNHFEQSRRAPDEPQILRPDGFGESELMEARRKVFWQNLHQHRKVRDRGLTDHVTRAGGIGGKPSRGSVGPPLVEGGPGWRAFDQQGRQPGQPRLHGAVERRRYRVSDQVRGTI